VLLQAPSVLSLHQSQTGGDQPIYLFRFVSFFIQRGITNVVNFFCPYSNIFNHAHTINRGLVKLELISAILQMPNSNSKHSTII
ncbi:hypothetical protein J0A68_22715, partial [Algoriphagus sp. H41]